MAFVDFTSATLADLGDLSNGVNFGKDAMGSGYGVINVNDIFRSGIKLDFTSLAKVDLSNLKRVANYTVRKNDLFFVRSSVKRDGVGLVSYSPTSDDTVVHCGFVIRFRLRDARANPLFLAYALRSPYYRETLKNLSSGTAIINISQSSVGSVMIPLPDRTIQDRIVSILSAYDDLIENNTRRIKILEYMAQMIYREWFVNFRFPGHENVRMVESELGPIPEGWRSGILRDVCESLDYGYTASATSEPIGPKFLRITDIVPSVIDWHNVPYCPPPDTNADRYALREGDIVVARTGATTGYAKRLNKRHPASVFASYLVRLRIKSGFSNHLFGVLVESDEYKRFIKANWSGAAQPQANAQVLTSIPIPISPERLQKQFSVIAEPLLDLKEALQFKNLNLRTTRDFLLPKLISGEVPVEAADKAAAELMDQTV